MIQETITMQNKLYIPAMRERLDAFNGELPECVLDALIMQQKRLRDENNGQEVITGKHIMVFLLALYSA